LKDLKKSGVKADQIVIQSPYRRDSAGSSFKAKDKIGGYPIVTDINKWRSGEGVLFTTIRRFKGLEADVVVMVDLPGFDESPIFTLNDYYVGVSRAKHVLEILARARTVMPQAENQ
jgi:DNA helicase IV